ncbi:MAG: hypothetical protein RIQ94_2560, partial [Pseudomonadota bacterium]
MTQQSIEQRYRKRNKINGGNLLNPVLDRLINDAIVANLDLKQALVRVKEARAQRWITITAGLPTITGKST